MCVLASLSSPLVSPLVVARCSLACGHLPGLGFLPARLWRPRSPFCAAGGRTCHRPDVKLPSSRAVLSCAGARSGRRPASRRCQRPAVLAVPFWQPRVRARSASRSRARCRRARQRRSGGRSASLLDGETAALRHGGGALRARRRDLLRGVFGPCIVASRRPKRSATGSIQMQTGQSTSLRRGAPPAMPRHRRVQRP